MISIPMVVPSPWWRCRRRPTVRCRSTAAYINSYIPNAGFSGVETITYTIRDTHGLTSTGLLTVLVDTIGDQPPVAQSAGYSVQAGATLPITLSAVDPNGQPLTWRSSRRLPVQLTGSVTGRLPIDLHGTHEPHKRPLRVRGQRRNLHRAGHDLHHHPRSNVPPVADDDDAETTQDSSVVINVWR